MKFISNKKSFNGTKLSLADQDDWGYTRKGVILTIDENNFIKGIELYSSKHGIARYNTLQGVTYCQEWKKNDPKLGIGITGQIATQIISDKITSEQIFHKIIEDLRSDLNHPYLKEILETYIIKKNQTHIDIDKLQKNN